MSLKQCAPQIFSHPLYTDYVDDVVQTLREKELQRFNFNYTSPQIGFRQLLVDFLKNFSEYQCFNRTTVHLGVYFLDVFMDNHQIAVERLNLVAIVCILLAAKLDEMEANIPKFAEVKQVANINNPSSDYFNLETLVLRFFEWDLLVPTVVNFIELYIEAIITEQDYNEYMGQVTDGISFKNLSNMKLTAASIIDEFLDLCLCHVNLPQELPSRLAASVIAATRYVLYLEPVWNGNLIQMTGYELSQVEDLVSELLRLRRKEVPNYEEKPKNTPDSGYISVHDGSESEEEDNVTTSKRKRIGLDPDEL